MERPVMTVRINAEKGVRNSVSIVDHRVRSVVCVGMASSNQESRVRCRLRETENPSIAAWWGVFSDV